MPLTRSKLQSSLDFPVRRRGATALKKGIPKSEAPTKRDTSNERKLRTATKTRPQRSRKTVPDYVSDSEESKSDEPSTPFHVKKCVTPKRSLRKSTQEKVSSDRTPASVKKTRQTAEAFQEALSDESDDDEVKELCTAVSAEKCESNVYKF